MTVVVYGSINMDLVCHTPDFPMPGQTLIGNRFETVPGGKGANQAVAAARLGVPTYMIGNVGNDSFGETLKHSLKSAGVRTDLVGVKANTSSGIASITVNESAENTIVVVPGANACVGIDPDDSLKRLTSIPNTSVLLMQLEIPLSSVYKAAEWAYNADIPIILDPAPVQALPDDLYRRLYLLTPNQTEAEYLVGFEVKTPNDAAKAAELLLKRGVQNVIIKMSSQGAFWASKETQQYFPAYPVKAIDTVAAGDAFNGAFAAALSNKLSFADAIQWALAASAYSVTKPGAQSSMPTLSELQTLIKTH